MWLYPFHLTVSLNLQHLCRCLIMSSVKLGILSGKLCFREAGIGTGQKLCGRWNGVDPRPSLSKQNAPGNWSPVVIKKKGSGLRTCITSCAQYGLQQRSLECGWKINPDSVLVLILYFFVFRYFLFFKNLSAHLAGSLGQVNCLFSYFDKALPCRRSVFSRVKCIYIPLNRTLGFCALLFCSSQIPHTALCSLNQDTCEINLP